MLACPIDAGWEINRLIELDYLSKDGIEIREISSLRYNKKTDKLFFLTDQENGYIGNILFFSKKINSRIKKIKVDQVIFFKNKKGKLLKEKIDSEGMTLSNNYAWVVSEGMPWNFRNPFTSKLSPRIYKFRLNDGILEKMIPLPRNWSDVESITFIKNNLLVAGQEKKPKYLSKSSEINHGKIAQYKIFNPSGIQNGKIEIMGTLKEIMFIEDYQIFLGLDKFENKTFINLYDSADIKNSYLKLKYNSWQIPKEGKWEGITYGPTLESGAKTLLVVNDVGAIKNNSSILVLTPLEINNNCNKNKSFKF